MLIFICLLIQALETLNKYKRNKNLKCVLSFTEESISNKDQQESLSKPSEADTAPSSSTVIDEVPIIKALTPKNSSEREENVNEIIEEPTNEEEGDFIDDDFGLSIKREWENLRQQQLQIEEEVNKFSLQTLTI